MSVVIDKTIGSLTGRSTTRKVAVHHMPRTVSQTWRPEPQSPQRYTRAGKVGYLNGRALDDGRARDSACQRAVDKSRRVRAETLCRRRPWNDWDPACADEGGRPPSRPDPLSTTLVDLAHHAWLTTSLATRAVIPSALHKSGKSRVPERESAGQWASTRFRMPESRGQITAVHIEELPRPRPFVSKTPLERLGPRLR
ncbi:hypothetical protein B0H11DRAFT_2200235 [Mycena galericulata]|nr:hypothetical protein B0H11DRAFT_2200235 [Mycena galericulata]